MGRKIFDFNSADDFFYGTQSSSTGAGGGPNSLVIDSVQINPGGKTVGCMFRWGGFAFNAGALSPTRSSIRTWK